MYPEICKIGPFTVYSYGLALAVAFITAAALAGKQAKKEGIDPEAVFNFAFICFVSGVAGARLFYVAENLGYFIKNPGLIIMLQQGGLSWFGGLFLGAFCGIVYLRARKIGAYKFLDLIVPYLALAQAIGRIGCLLNGCCFGNTLVPTQIYASLALLVIFITLRFLQDAPHRAGKIFFLYLALYAFKRFFIEFARAQHPEVLAGLTLFQLISIGVFCAAVFKLIKCGNTR